MARCPSQDYDQYIQDLERQMDAAGYEEVAKTMMEHIAYDNGFVHRDAPMHYPKKHLTRITKAAKVFFDANPEMLTDETLEVFCVGDTDDFAETYGHLVGFEELNAALGDYFDPA